MMMRYRRLIPRSSSKNSLSRHCSTKQAKFFLTTPIFYVNGPPHLGHAYTMIVADVIARFHRNDGKDVYLLTGTDEHGQKVAQSAAQQNLTPLQFATTMSNKFRTLADALNISYDKFIRTTDEAHRQSVTTVWNTLLERGHLYKGKYEGWYSVRDECFYVEADLVNGKAPTGADVEWLAEDTYFFRLSAFTEKLKQHYKSCPQGILPEGKFNEAYSFLCQDGGLKDLSVSRTAFSWGLPVPGDSKHVIYVWLDALVNYISALGYGGDNKLMERYWPADLHIVGKDILRFHAIYWPAFLMAAGVELPKTILAHGWWTVNGEKMSKSVGNVVDPFAVIEKYCADYLRFFLIAEAPLGNDADYRDEQLQLRVSLKLVNELGNLAQRVLSFAYKTCDQVIPVPGGLTEDDNKLLQAAEDMLPQCRKYVEQYNLNKMAEEIIGIARLGNKYVEVHAPWVLAKTDLTRMNTVVYVLIEHLRRTAILINPIIPSHSSRILDQMNVPESMRTFASIVDRIDGGRRIPAKPQPIFSKFHK